jgi:hypothetical protein
MKSTGEGTTRAPKDLPARDGHAITGGRTMVISIIGVLIG